MGIVHAVDVCACIWPSSSSSGTCAAASCERGRLLEFPSSESLAATGQCIEPLLPVTLQQEESLYLYPPTAPCPSRPSASALPLRRLQTGQSTSE